jgi:hypothetical protein
MTPPTWTCPCGERYELRVEVGRPVFVVIGGEWKTRAAVCTNPACKRNLRKTRADMRHGYQPELGTEAA